MISSTQPQKSMYWNEVEEKNEKENKKQKKGFIE